MSAPPPPRVAVVPTFPLGPPRSPCTAGGVRCSYRRAHPPTGCWGRRRRANPPMASAHTGATVPGGAPRRTCLWRRLPPDQEGGEAPPAAAAPRLPLPPPQQALPVVSTAGRARMVPSHPAHLCPTRTAGAAVGVPAARGTTGTVGIRSSRTAHPTRLAALRRLICRRRCRPPRWTCPRVAVEGASTAASLTGVAMAVGLTAVKGEAAAMAAPTAVVSTAATRAGQCPSGLGSCFSVGAGATRGGLPRRSPMWWCSAPPRRRGDAPVRAAAAKPGRPLLEPCRPRQPPAPAVGRTGSPRCRRRRRQWRLRLRRRRRPPRRPPIFLTQSPTGSGSGGIPGGNPTTPLPFYQWSCGWQASTARPWCTGWSM